jgi:hypothetical protein
MRYEKSKLEEILERKYHTITIYLCRAEFSHIKIERNSKGIFLNNVTNRDIAALKKIILSRRSSKYKRS